MFTTVRDCKHDADAVTGRFSKYLTSVERGAPSVKETINYVHSYFFIYIVWSMLFLFSTITPRTHFWHKSRSNCIYVHIYIYMFPTTAFCFLQALGLHLFSSLIKFFLQNLVLRLKLDLNQDSFFNLPHNSSTNIQYTNLFFILVFWR